MRKGTITYSRPPAGFPPAARVVGIGSTDPQLQVRGRRGEWLTDASVEDDPAWVRTMLVQFEDSAAWARAQGIRVGRRKARRG